MEQKNTLQKSVIQNEQAHKLQIDAASDTECPVCGWAGVLLEPLPDICTPGEFSWNRK